METTIRFTAAYNTLLQIIETSGDVKIPSKGDGYIFDGDRFEVTDVSYEYDFNVVTIHIKVA